MYGRCGSAYVVEDLEPLPDAQKSLQVKGSFDEFAKASSLGLALLDLLDELETLFDEPFHLCDIKPEHFGISDQVSSIASTYFSFRKISITRELPGVALVNISNG